MRFIETFPDQCSIEFELEPKELRRIVLECQGHSCCLCDFVRGQPRWHSKVINTLALKKHGSKSSPLTGLFGITITARPLATTAEFHGEAASVACSGPATLRTTAPTSGVCYRSYFEIDRTSTCEIEFVKRYNFLRSQGKERSKATKLD